VAEPENLTTHSVYSLLDAAPTTILVVREDGIIDYCNPAAAECFGYRGEEMIGLPVEALVPEKYARGHVGRRTEHAARPSPSALRIGRHLLARRKDGSVFPVETSLIPVETAHAVWTLVYAVDITERLKDEKRLSDLSRAYLTLAQMNQAIVRASDELALFSETCRIAVEQGGYVGAWIGTKGSDSNVECLAKAGAVDDFITRMTVSADPENPYGRGPTGRVLREGASLYVQDYAAAAVTAPWHELAADFDIGSTATLPLRRSRRVAATLTLYSRTPNAFDEEVRSLLEGMASNISFALDGFEAVAQLRELALQRKELSSRLVAAQEAERARIAADVHDDSVQALAALGLRLGMLKNQLTETAPEAAATVGTLLLSVGEISAGLRDLLFELEQADESVQLVEMVDQAAAHIFDDGTIRCSVNVDLTKWNGASTLSATDRGQALRIVKEALFNARKHSGATEIAVTIAPGPDGVWVKVADNGSGFENQDAYSPGHRGMANMFDRAAVSGGTCGVHSDSNGTVVRLWVPYDDTAKPWGSPVEPG
jgi:PAS domain S-box-containing protein